MNEDTLAYNSRWLESMIMEWRHDNRYQACHQEQLRPHIWSITSEAERTNWKWRVTFETWRNLSSFLFCVLRQGLTMYPICPWTLSNPLASSIWGFWVWLTSPQTPYFVYCVSITSWISGVTKFDELGMVARACSPRTLEVEAKEWIVSSRQWDLSLKQMDTKSTWEGEAGGLPQFKFTQGFIVSSWPARTVIRHSASKHNHKQTIFVSPFPASGILAKHIPPMVFCWGGSCA